MEPKQKLIFYTGKGTRPQINGYSCFSQGGGRGRGGRGGGKTGGEQRLPLICLHYTHTHTHTDRTTLNHCWRKGINSGVFQRSGSTHSSQHVEGNNSLHLQTLRGRHHHIICPPTPISPHLPSTSTNVTPIRPSLCPPSLHPSIVSGLPLVAAPPPSSTPTIFVGGTEFYWTLK